MPNVKTLQRSFGGGEVTPEFFGRIDDTKYQSGAAKVRNFITLPHGPATNRPGTTFVRKVKDSTKATRLIPFTYSTTQTFAIELGAGYFRFHTNGATLLAPAGSAWLTTTAYTVGTVVTNGGSKYYCTTTHTSGTFATDLAAGKWYLMPATGEYEIPNTYAEADLFDIHYVQSADVLTLAHPGYEPRELRRYGATDWRLAAISFAAPIAAPTGQSAAATVATGSGFYSMSYVITALDSEGLSESVASSSATCSNNLYTTGNYNTISWSSVATASRYNVYKLSGGLYGYIGQTTGTSIVDDNITADVSKTPPIYDTAFSGSGNYPGAVSYFEQRRCFAGTTNKPQNIWMTRSGTESTLAYSLPVRDDDRIAFRVAAREANTIRHIVPLSNLILLTSAAEWRITSINSDAITPSSISVRPQSYIGASNVQPVIVGNSILYCAARGGHVRELGYSEPAAGYVTGDVSLRAPHLFDNLGIVDMAYAKAPQPICWFISSNGKLLGLTYVPEQQVGSWHQHDTKGQYESCCVVAEDKEDALYVIVKRTIDGSSVRYVERLASRLFSDPEDAFFVDCGATYDGAVAQTLTPGAGATTAGTTGVTFTAGGSAFSSGNVGSFIRYRYEETDDAGIGTGEFVNAIAEITGYTSGTIVTATIVKAFPSTSAIASGEWSISADTISGLTWLEGATVNVLADGAVHPQCVVTSGAITLDTEAHVVQIGLPIEADLQTLPLAMQVDGAFGQGRYKNVNKAWLRVHRSSGIFIGPNADELVEAKQRTTEDYGNPPALKSQEIPVMTTPTWADSGQVYIRQSDPLPLTIVSLTLEVAVGG